MTGYTRQSDAAIDPGQPIDAAPLDAEFNAIQTAFDATLGHTHDGSTGSGPKLNLTNSTSGTLTVARGGTGGTDADTARSNLGLVIGTNVQAYDAELTAIAGLTSAADKGIQFTGAGTAGTFDLTTAGKALLDDADATAQRATLGLGTIATQAASAVNITGGTITGITDLAVADGGTGASTAADARTNLGIVIGTNVQAYDANLAAIAGLTPTNGYVITGNGSAWTSVSPSGVATPTLFVRDEKASGAHGGNVGGGWVSRNMNTVGRNTISGASLASDLMTLPAGTYEVAMSAPIYGNVGKHRIRLYNVTDNIATLYGSSETRDGSELDTSRSFILDTFTITAQKTFRLDHYTAYSVMNGLGLACGISGVPEIYSIAQFKKVA